MISHGGLFFHSHDVPFVRERLVLVAVSLVELVLELDPVQSQRMKETLHGVHTHQHSERYPD